MKRQYRCAISTLRRAITLEDATTAVAMARQLLPLRDQIRIEAGSPVFYYRGDPSTRSRCTAMSVHRLVIGGEAVCEWTRQSIGGPGLDLNHPAAWAAVAIDPALSRYELVIRPMLEVFGLVDLAPAIPEPD
jgi:hypothetical protein